MVGHCLRFWPGWKELKTFVKNKKFGSLKYISFKRMCPTPYDSWMWNEKLSGGVLLDLHIHDIDMVNFILGKPDKINASFLSDEKSKIKIINAQYYYKNCIAHLEAGWIGKNNGEFYMEYEAIFKKSVVAYKEGKLLIFNNEQQKFTSKDLSNASGHLDELKYFIECIKKNRNPRICPPEESRDSIELAIQEKNIIRKQHGNI